MTKTVKIEAPLVNGEQWLRNTEFPFRIEGPYSSEHGEIYALAKRDDVESAYKKARGKNRQWIKTLLEK